MLSLSHVGTYKVSSTIIGLYNTVIVGNPNNIPVIVTSADFVGKDGTNGIISSDCYIDAGGEWYLSVVRVLLPHTSSPLHLTKTRRQTSTARFATSELAYPLSRPRMPHASTGRLVRPPASRTSTASCPEIQRPHNEAYV